MCGRYTLATPDPAAVRARFPVGEAVEVHQRYNVAPSDPVLAVTCDREGAPRGELLRWGLLPPWTQGPGTGPPLINARVETVMEKAVFRRAFEHYRCLVVADGFYEWGRLHDGSKQPYLITAEQGLFAFAGLWSVWRGGETVVRSCAILTTAADEAVGRLHDRMPVILAPEAEAAWLDCTLSPDTLLRLLSGQSQPCLALRAVNPAVNDVRHDGPECLAPPAQAMLF